MYILSYKIKTINKIFIIFFSLLTLSSFVFLIMYKSKKVTVDAEESKTIKYVEFNVSSEILSDSMKEDVESHKNDDQIKINWIDILSYLACKYGGNFKKYSKKDVKNYVSSKKNNENPEENLENQKLLSYYKEAYNAILSGFLGEKEDGQYGLKVRSPIAYGYPFTHYDDFGKRRTFGYSRPHLGHDMFCSVGTPVVAVEDGYVEIMGWNRFGGWRIGIRSHDKKRYWYYAHLRKNKPFNPKLKEGDEVHAGDIIGYVGKTGYSSKENVNNLQRSHLHIGLQLIFDESLKDSPNQIWISLYELVKFLKSNYL